MTDYAFSCTVKARLNAKGVVAQSPRLVALATYLGSPSVIQPNPNRGCGRSGDAATRGDDYPPLHVGFWRPFRQDLKEFKNNRFFPIARNTCAEWCAVECDWAKRSKLASPNAIGLVRFNESSYFSVGIKRFGSVEGTIFAAGAAGAISQEVRITPNICLVHAMRPRDA